MRTKALIGAAIAMAAGLLSASAQVYSVNVVGYVNASYSAGIFSLAANPLDDGTNTITSVGAGLPNKTQVETWNGSTFSLATKTNGAWTVNFPLAPGTGFFVKTPGGTGITTNTFVGNVIVAPGGGQTNKALVASILQLVGSPVPFAGNLNDAYGTNSLNIGAQLPNKSQVQTWTGSAFQLSTKTNGVWTVNFPIAVGQGFFVKPNTATNWTQTLQ
jgi:hypothetical protein